MKSQATLTYRPVVQAFDSISGEWRPIPQRKSFWTAAELAELVRHGVTA